MNAPFGGTIRSRMLRLSAVGAALAAVAAMTSPALAAEVTWIGTTSTAWATGSNWVGSAVPTSSDVVVFNGLDATRTTRNINFASPTTGVGTPYVIQSIVMSGSQRSLSIGSSAGTAGTLRLTGATINSASNVILRNSGTGSLTIASTVSTGLGPMGLELGNSSDNAILIDNSGAITISATVTGISRTLTLSGSGAGALTLSASNTYTGTTQLTSGILRAGDSGAFSSSLLLLNGGTLSSDSATARSFTNNIRLGGNVAFGDAIGTGALSFGSVDLNGTQTLTTAVSTTFSGAVTNGSLTKAGAATLSLTNSGNTFATLAISAGTVSIGGNTTVTGLAGTGGGLNLAAGTLTVNAAADQSFGLAITGTGGLTKSGAATLVLAAANSGYSGVTTLSAGTLRGGDNAAFGSGTLALNGGTITGTGAAARSFSTGAVSIGGNVQFGDGTGTGALTFAGPVNLGGGNRTLTTTVSTTFSGAVTNGSLTKDGAATLALTNSGNNFGGLTITAGTVAIRGNTSITALAGSAGALDLAAGNTLTVNQATSGTAAMPFTGSGGFTKSGAGVLVLTADSSGYAGTTTVSGGSLVANGILGGSVSVAGGGTLSGSGTVGTVTIDTGATLSPGNSPGVLTTGDITWAGGGNYNWQLFDATLGAGIGWDLVRGGTLSITATPSSRFNVNLWSLASINPDVSGTAQSFSFTTTGTYTIGTFANISGATGDWYTINTGSTNGTGGFRGYNPALGGFTLLSTGTSLDLVYTHTPLTSYTWVAGAGLWSNASNWAEADTPEGDAAIAFAGPGGVSTNDLSSGTGANLLGTVTSLSFAGSATGSYDVAGTAITLGSGGVANDSSFAQTVSAGITLAAPATLAANAASLTFSGTIDTAGRELTVGGAAATTLGAVTGTGGLVKTDPGTATLTAAVASPNVTVAGGVLALGDGNLLADSSAVTVNSGSLGMGAFNDTVGSFTITGGALGGSGTLTAGTYALGGGTVAGNLGAGMATSSAGTTTLAGTLAGTLTLAGGTVALGASDRISDASAVAINSGSLGMGAFNDTVGSFAITGGSLGGSGTLTAATYSLGGGTVAANLGAGAATSAAGTTTLAGTIAGNLTVAGGVVSLAASDRIGNGSAVTINSGSLGLGAFNDTVGSFTITGGALGGSGMLTATTYSLGGGTVAANLGAGAATSAAGTTTLAGTIAGNLTVAGGVVSLAASDRIGNGSAVTINSGSLGLGAFNDTVGSFTITGGALGGSGTLTATTYSLGGGTVAANLGAGAATSAAGSTTLVGTLAGNLTVAGGTVALGSAGRLGAGSVVTANTGSLSLGGNETVASFAQSGGSVGGTGRITAGSYTLTGGTTAVGFAGSGGVTVNSGNPTLAGDGTGFTGATTIGGGNLTLTSGNALGSGAVILSAGSLRASAGQTIANAITIGGTGGAVFYTQDFNSLGSGLPANWTTGTGASGSSVGTSVAFTTTPVSWADTAGAFKNYAATTGLTSASSSTAQNASTDRALGIRQTGGFGDPGAAFNYAFSTTGQVIDSLSLDLMLLAANGYSTTWSIQYGVGTSPTSFTTLGTWTDPGTWGSTTVTYSGGAVAGMSNLASGVFRVVALTSATGSGTRDSMGIDNFRITLKSAAAATLGAADASAVTYSGPLAISGTAELTAVAGGTATFSGAISGSAGAITKTGAGTVILTGANTYAGGVTVSQGTLVGTTDSLKGTITNAAAVILNQATSGTYTGVMSGAGSVAKTGVGTVTITTPQTFTGPTTITAGALALSGSGGLASSLITVAADGLLDARGLGGGLVLGATQTLAGTGDVAGLVVVQGGATVAPGASPGTLNGDAFTFGPGGNYNWQIYDISGGPGIGWDLLSGTGAMTITATAEDPFNVNLWSLSGLPDTGGQLADFDPNFDYFFKIAEFASISGFAADKFAVNTAGTNGTGGFANSLNGTFSVARGTSVGGTANELYVVYAAIPEPATLTLAGIGLAAAAWAGRRRRGPACR